MNHRAFLQENKITRTGQYGFSSSTLECLIGTGRWWTHSIMARLLHKITTATRLGDGIGATHRNRESHPSCGGESRADSTSAFDQCAPCHFLALSSHCHYPDPVGDPTPTSLRTFTPNGPMNQS
uniref:Uncharacterized protein n=1 Tax=Schistocephalus solidus TaxID=70667 RepID=A0A0X3PHF5_SCHSO